MSKPHDTLLADKSQISRFERGFKSWSENTAKTIRSRLKLSKYDPLSPYQLANYLKVSIITPKEVVGLSTETADFLTSSKGDEWSAITVRDKVDLIIINPIHPKGRIANTIMHELSHILRDHKSAQVFIHEDGLTFRNFDEIQEAEADWLAGTLLLPRDALVNCFFRKYSEEDACSIYGVSSALYRYRMNVSGVARQFSHIRQ